MKHKVVKVAGLEKFSFLIQECDTGDRFHADVEVWDDRIMTGFGDTEDDAISVALLGLALNLEQLSTAALQEYIKRTIK